MRIWRIALYMIGALALSTAGAAAQSQTVPAPQQPSTAPSGQQVLTPEQIEELQAMVARMQRAMQDMVQSARGVAGRMASGQTIVLSTNEVAAIAIGAAGGAILIDLLGGGGLASIAGAVVGGVAAHWLITAPPSVIETAGST